MSEFVVRDGMSKSVFENKYSRKKPGGGYQSWSERVSQVVDGNFGLCPEFFNKEEYERSQELSKKGLMVSAGRHLQHGDSDQSKRNGEVFVNCSTAMFSFVGFWLLLKGAGVGRCYDSDLCRVNWDCMPNVRIVINGPNVDGSPGHPDYESWMETVQEAERKYDSESESVRWFKVGDSAEGWTRVIEILETAAWQERHRDKLFVFDFSDVRCKGSPIKGQQGRPASGPVPYMRALAKVVSIKGAGMKPWKQSLYIDHYLAACIATGGIRRSSRIAVKSWRDRDILDFIDVKRGGWLYTANNSVGVDSEFWEQAKSPAPSHGRRVFEAMVSAAYFDGTGEPAFLNMDKMSWNPEGTENISSANLFNKKVAEDIGFHKKTSEMIDNILAVAKKKRYPYIVNPCGEVVLSLWGGYCTVGDVCLANADSIEEATDALKLMSHFLIRTNTMDYLYKAEVDRTNRIGVSIIGIHEFAYRHFGLSFKDMIDESKSQSFWDTINSFRMTVEESSFEFSKRIGVNVPHTATTIKPAGTTAKIMACTEGCHLPSYDYYMRWVQYSVDSPMVDTHRSMGYPIMDVSHVYSGHLVIGFPTKMPITDIMGDNVTLAGDASMEDQYKWLQLLEKYWLGTGNNQISYTMKYDPKKVSYESFMKVILENQKMVRACAVMAQSDMSAYAYQPEERISKEDYGMYMSRIDNITGKELYSDDSLSCSNGSCPIEFDNVS